MMNLALDASLSKYHNSKSQIAKILTEKWVSENSQCPRCGNFYLNKFEANRPVADLLCNDCEVQFELKSKKRSFSKMIADGAYSTMIERIDSEKR